ncbi:MAG: hypothetical protein AB1744_07105, partial [Candidatus Zixiibacteriota bacterium]
MLRPWTIVVLIVPGLVSGGASLSAARTELSLVGADIPRYLSTGGSGIFTGSDSLFLNGSLLQRNVDYSFDQKRAAFDLSAITFHSHDTLHITYEPLPGWLRPTYGRPIPQAGSSPISPPEIPARPKTVRQPEIAPQISITGAKSFVFSARSAGASNFSQTLDLHLEGTLAPGIEVTGTVSDRGYDPAYGPSNSRLSELDRINLMLKSPLVSAQVGDMTVGSRFDTRLHADKRVSGAAVTVHTDRWYAEALAARPRGRFETVRFFGSDGLQGPYRIGSGSSPAPIVPGSEQVWLDGQLLERGAEKDYTVDYPTGRITFSVNHPIDLRSRIEIDYEPQATDFRAELFSTGGGAVAGDSTLYLAVEFLREGDDKELSLRGEYSDEERALLDSIGDSVAQAVRSGVTVDTNGSYLLIIDSLPDSVFQYVGSGNGDYSVTFSFFGSAQGDYRFLGGDRYQFVGRGRGDYLPVIILPAPARTDYYNARIGWRNSVTGDILFELRQTRFDRNLLSQLDDGDNHGSLYSVAANKKWSWHNRPNQIAIKGR